MPKSAAKVAKKLLLFDIDGTLIDTGGAGLKSLREGFFEAFPDFCDQPFPHLELGGATDHGIAMQVFAHFGLEDSMEFRSRFLEAYAEKLEQSLMDFSRAGRGGVLPGVIPLLEALSCDARYCLGVLTGNLRRGAWIKLEHYGMAQYFGTGAYGDDHYDRNALGPVAWRRAVEFHGESFSLTDVVVIGDTPRDIACARALGARALGVATGTVSCEQLADAHPDCLLPSLEDLQTVLTWLDSF